MGEGRSLWMSPQVTTGSYMSICGFGTLLNDTSAVVWHLPLLPENPPSFVCPEVRTMNSLIQLVVRRIKVWPFSD